MPEAAAHLITSVSVPTNKVALPAIDLLRGISAFGVVLFHSRVDLWVGYREIHSAPDSYSSLDRALAWLGVPVSQFGYLVMLFFVISGFCIHLPLAGGADVLQLRSYALRRFFRIFPPYAAALLLCVLVELIFDLAGQSRGAGGGIFLASFAMIQNYLYHGGQVPSDPSLWSIPVEVELYVAYPVLLSFLRRKGWSMGAGWAVTAGFSMIALGFCAAGCSWPNTNFLKFWVLWWSGAWLAERWRTGTLPEWGGVAWMASGVTCACLLAGWHWGWESAYMHMVWGAVSFLTLWCCLCLPSSVAQGAFEKTWPGRAGVKIGIMSYSLYLIHFPVLQLLGMLWLWCMGSKPSSFLVAMAGSMLCIPLAWLFHRAIESPSHLLGKKCARSPFWAK